MTRDGAGAALKRLGASVGSGVTKKTQALIAGEGGGGKRAKAEQLGTPVWDEAQLLELLRSHESGGVPAADVEPDLDLDPLGG